MRQTAPCMRLALAVLMLAAAFLLAYAIWLQARIWLISEPIYIAFHGAWPPQPAPDIRNLVPILGLALASWLAAAAATSANTSRPRRPFVLSATCLILCMLWKLNAPTLTAAITGEELSITPAVHLAAMSAHIPLILLSLTAVILAATLPPNQTNRQSAIWLTHLCDSLWLCVFAAHALTLSP